MIEHAAELDDPDSEVIPDEVRAWKFQTVEHIDASDSGPALDWVDHWYEEERVYWGCFRAGFTGAGDYDEFRGRGFRFTIANRALAEWSTKSAFDNVPGEYAWYAGKPRLVDVLVCHPRVLPENLWEFYHIGRTAGGRINLPSVPSGCIDPSDSHPERPPIELSPSNPDRLLPRNPDVETPYDFELHGVLSKLKIN